MVFTCFFKLYYFLLQDTASGTWFGESALRELGTVDLYFPNYRGSWAFIGYKGKSRVNWVKQSSKGRGQGPATVTADIPLQSTDSTDNVLKVISKFIHILQLLI